MTETVTLILPPAEVALFMEFQKHHDKVMTLLASKAFDIRNGSFTVHLDGAGVIGTIDRSDRLFTAGS